MNHIKIKKWVDDLIWCPSQCYGVFELFGQSFTIYLRWRHQDPWSCCLIIGNLLKKEDGYIWSTYLFSKYDVYFGRKDKLSLIKRKAITLVNKEINEVLKIPKENLPLYISDDDHFVRNLVNIILKSTPVTQQE